MKKSIFIAAFAIAMAAAVSSCGNNKSEQTKEPTGTPIGKITMIEKDDGYALLDQNGYELGVFAKVVDNKSFITAQNKDGYTLMKPTGTTFCQCDSFTVKPVYTVKADEKTDQKYILASVQTWKVGFDVNNQNNLCKIDGLKKEEYPLTNGQIIFKLSSGYGIAQIGADEAIMDAECEEVVVVNTGSKVYYLIKTIDWAGYIDETGKDIKALTSDQFKIAKKNGRELWSEGKVSARSVKKI